MHNAKQANEDANFLSKFVKCLPSSLLVLSENCLWAQRNILCFISFKVYLCKYLTKFSWASFNPSGAFRSEVTLREKVSSWKSNYSKCSERFVACSLSLESERLQNLINLEKISAPATHWLHRFIISFRSSRNCSQQGHTTQEAADDLVWRMNDSQEAWQTNISVLPEARE